MKRTVFASAVLLLSAFLFESFGGMIVNAEPNIGTAETLNPEMKVGASVRLSENGNGIRFTMQLPKEKYDNLMNSSYEDVEFGMLIAPVEYIAAYGELDEEHVFGNQAVYDYAVWTDTDNDGSGDKWIYSGDGSRVRITNITAEEMQTDPDDESYMIHTGSLINLKEENLLRGFVGMGYIEYVSEGESHYVFASSEDNTRSMATVAQSALDASNIGLTTEQRELLQKNYVQKGGQTVIGGDVELNGTLHSINGMNMRYDSGEGIKIVSEADAQEGENISDKPVLFTNATGRYAVIEFSYIVRENSNANFGLGIDVFSDESQGSPGNRQTIRLMNQGVRIADTFGQNGVGTWYKGDSETGTEQKENTTYANLTTNLFDRDTERRVRFVRNANETYIYVKRVGTDNDYVLLGRFVTKNSSFADRELAYGLSLTQAAKSTVEIFDVSIALGGGEYVPIDCQAVIGGNVELSGTLRSTNGMNMRHDPKKGICIFSEAGAQGGENISNKPVLFTNATGKYAVIEFSYIVRKNSDAGFGLGIDVLSEASQGSPGNRQTIRLSDQGVRIADTFGQTGVGTWYKGESETGTEQKGNTTYANLTTNLFARDTERRVRFVRNANETYIYVKRVGTDNDYVLLGRFVTKNSSFADRELAYGISLTAADNSTVEIFGISISLGQEKVNTVIGK